MNGIIVSAFWDAKDVVASHTNDMSRDDLVYEARIAPFLTWDPDKVNSIDICYGCLGFYSGIG